MTKNRVVLLGIMLVLLPACSQPQRIRVGVEPDAGAATAYDAARMLFDAFKRAKSTESSAVRNALAQTKDFAGVTGKIILDANRNAQVPVYMLRIEKDGKFTLQHQG